MTPYPCTCGRVVLDGEEVSRNWNPDCLEHGEGSKWWEEEGKRKLDEQRARAVEWQQRAIEARRKARGG